MRPTIDQTIEKLAAKITRGLDDGTKERGALYVGAAFSGSHVLSTFGSHMAILRKDAPTRADAKPIPRNWSLATARVTLPDDFRRMVRRVATCASRRSHSITLALDSRPGGGILLLHAEDGEGNEAREWAPIPERVPRFTVMHLDARAVLDALLMPRGTVLHFNPGANQERVPVQFATPDDAVRVVLAPMDAGGSHEEVAKRWGPMVDAADGHAARLARPARRQAATKAATKAASTAASTRATSRPSSTPATAPTSRHKSIPAASRTTPAPTSPRTIRCADCGCELVRHPAEPATDPKRCRACWQRQTSPAADDLKARRRAAALKAWATMRARKEATSCAATA